MIACPKCGSMRVIGPHHRKAEGYEPERLLYTCGQCGFQQIAPCLDRADEPAPAGREQPK